MEMLKKLMIAMALLVSLMPISSVYAIGLDDEFPEDKKEMEDVSPVYAVGELGAEESEAAAVAYAPILQEEYFGVVRKRAKEVLKRSVYVPRQVDLKAIERKRAALTMDERRELNKQLIDACPLYSSEISVQAVVREMEHLLQLGADPNIQTSRGIPMVAFVFYHTDEYVPLVHLLIDYGANPNTFYADYTNNTPLLYAVDRNYYKTVDALLAHGVDPDKGRNYNGRTPLIEAVQNDNRELIALLLAYGARANACDARGNMPLMEVCSAKAIELLINNDANINGHNRKGETALMCAVRFNRPDLVEALIRYDADVNCVDAQDHNALHYLRFTEDWDRFEYAYPVRCKAMKIQRLLIHAGIDLENVADVVKFKEDSYMNIPGFLRNRKREAGELGDALRDKITPQLADIVGDYIMAGGGRDMRKIREEATLAALRGSLLTRFVRFFNTLVYSPVASPVENTVATVENRALEHETGALLVADEGVMVVPPREENE